MNTTLKECLLDIALVAQAHIEEALVPLRAIPPGLAVVLDGLLIVSG